MVGCNHYSVSSGLVHIREMSTHEFYVRQKLPRLQHLCVRRRHIGIATHVRHRGGNVCLVAAKDASTTLSRG